MVWEEAFAFFLEFWAKAGVTVAPGFSCASEDGFGLAIGAHSPTKVSEQR